MEGKGNAWCECPSGLRFHSTQNQKVLGQRIQSLRHSSKHRGSDLSQVSTSLEGRLKWLCFLLMLCFWLPQHLCSTQAKGTAPQNESITQPGILGKKPVRRLHNIAALRKQQKGVLEETAHIPSFLPRLLPAHTQNHGCAWGNPSHLAARATTGAVCAACLRSS